MMTLATNNAKSVMPQGAMRTTPPLDAVDQVEVVDLRQVSSDRVQDYLEAAATVGAPRVRVRGSDAQGIAALWSELPPGEQDRCHVPPFGLRFFSGDHLLLEASLCWQCNNIFGVADGNRFSFAFNASASPSRELLARARAAVLAAGLRWAPDLAHTARPREGRGYWSRGG